MIEYIYTNAIAMSAVAAVKYITEEEYLKAEEKSLTKNEYYKGEIFAMAGASISHNRITRNTQTEIDIFLRDKSCEIFPSDLRIQVEANSLFTYPDLSIVCTDLEFYKKRKDTIRNPTVLIEVLSPSTQNYDRGEKFALYRDLPSLKEYILISSTKILIEKYTKQSDNEWIFTEFKKPTDQFEIESIGFLVTVEALYRKVNFEEG